MNFKKLTNSQKAELYKKNYSTWKQTGLDDYSYFLIFKGFVESYKLKNISGNALKLYIYLGMYAKNNTGEIWHSTHTIAKYFNKSERTIRTWTKELEDMHLIKKMQLEFNGVSHTYLQPYDLGTTRKSDR
ncbi:helix-turn-helix domain-containing protein [Clostridium tertium]|uniref:helix-turn-helix domain-containing protein n=1 Tax=Clostridium tertium TaxID=1559 RepID=UPI0018AB89F3|nr:helix-turn-helix domain-containing protein [Clostridium tertium]MDB1971468.1 helix-turn-helix domain-containing protein [Clostridium tertium]